MNEDRYYNRYIYFVKQELTYMTRSVLSDAICNSDEINITTTTAVVAGFAHRAETNMYDHGLT